MIRISVRLLLAAMVHAGAQTAAAQDIQRSAIRVAIAPINRGGLSGVAWNALTEECRRIWAREGVTIDWSGRDAGGATVTLPLVFDDRELTRHETHKGAALGVTVFAGRSRRVVVSGSRAQRLVAARGGFARPGDVLQREIAVGMLMGRVVAHEIGHALLDRAGHTPRGLMRAQFDVGETRPALQGQFALSEDQRRRLEARFRDAHASGQLAQSAFTENVPAAPAPPQRRHDGDPRDQ